MIFQVRLRNEELVIITWDCFPSDLTFECYWVNFVVKWKNVFRGTHERVPLILQMSSDSPSNVWLFYYYHESKSFIAINGINLQVINGIQVNFCGKTKSIGVVWLSKHQFFWFNCDSFKSNWEISIFKLPDKEVSSNDSINAFNIYFLGTKPHLSIKHVKRGELICINYYRNNFKWNGKNWKEKYKKNQLKSFFCVYYSRKRLLEKKLWLLWEI